MKKRLERTADKIIPKIALPVIFFAGMLMFAAIMVDTRGTSEQNNAYIRVINCIVSHNASRRTQEDIESCYVAVERDLDTKLQRYDEDTK